MYDLQKPDLLIHPKYFKSILKYNLDAYFNVLQLKDLTINTDIKPIVIDNTCANYLTNVKLKKFFENTNYDSGIKPEHTTYTFDNEIPIYNIEENGPRYVIWTMDDPLTVCATYLDRIEIYDLYQACERAKHWSYTIETAKSIIVFDLDDTLIDRNGNPLKYSQKVLDTARDVYDIMVLYSHGSNLHVDQHLLQFKTPTRQIEKPLFDLVLSKSKCDKRSSKNLLYVYNYFPNVRFKNATLVDDSLFNWTPEYNRIIVPTTQSIYQVLKFLDNIALCN